MELTLERQLAQLVADGLAPFGFKRIEPAPVVESADVIEAWKRKTLNMNRGVALIAFSNPDANPGEFTRAVKKAVGKKIGYFPFFYELGLQVILVGRGLLGRSGDLDRFVDEKNTMTVVLQSIHLIDLDATEFISRLPDSEGIFEVATKLPGWAQSFEMMMKIRKVSPFFQFEPGKTKCQFASRTGRAAISVRTWGQTLTGPFIDAIEEAISNFVNKTDTTGF